LNSLILVGLGGALGASLRFGVGQFFKTYFFHNYYFISTFIVNIIGCFFIGYLISFTQNKNISQDFIKYFFIIGILGSFTTFSTFSIEAIEMINEKKTSLALIYIFSSLFLCLLFTFIGLNFNKIIS
tara:strand:- start:36 stop:416 length:381 start_codon:yes stop_codon:yes gene_type:complete